MSTEEQFVCSKATEPGQHVMECNVSGVMTAYHLEPEECSEVVEVGSQDFFLYLFMSILACFFAGMMSGLTVGLMSFDEKNLSILMLQSKDPLQRKYAKNVHELIKDHHFLLVTLLFWNAAAFESLPLFLDRLVPSWAAIIISVTGILIFGEIVPQALCVGPRRLMIGSMAYWPVQVLSVFSWPVAKVLGKVLDHLLGTREERDSQFLYVPKDALGLPSDGQLALVEVHGLSDAQLDASKLEQTMNTTMTPQISSTNPFAETANSNRTVQNDQMRMPPSPRPSMRPSGGITTLREQPKEGDTAKLVEDETDA